MLMLKTSVGYSIRAVGINPEAARYAGINVKRNILLAMAISGGAAGLGGAVKLQPFLIDFTSLFLRVMVLMALPYLYW